VLLSDLRSTAETVGHPMAQRTPPSLVNNKFMGMTEYVMKSFHNLLVGESGSSFDSDSSRGSHRPSHECFITSTPEGHVESIHEGEATPTNDLDDEVKRDAWAPPRLPVE
jgi:hypothetical protein